MSDSPSNLFSMCNHLSKVLDECMAHPISLKTTLNEIDGFREVEQVVEERASKTLHYPVPFWKLMISILITTDLHRGYSRKTQEVHSEFAKNVPKDFDILLDTGDLGNAIPAHYEDGLRFLREEVVGDDRPILHVTGNHGFWDYKKEYTLSELLHEHREYHFRYQIHHLQEDGPFDTEFALFVGWNGWYDLRPTINDVASIPPRIDGMSMNKFFRNISRECFQKAMDSAKDCSKLVVAATHFPVVKDPRLDGDMDGKYFHFNDVNKYCDVLVMGHSHRFVYRGERDTILLNAGSGYDDPKWLFVDILGPDKKDIHVWTEASYQYREV